MHPHLDYVQIHTRWHPLCMFSSAVGAFSRLSTAQPAEPCAYSPCRSECANIGQDQQTARARRPVDPIARWLARLELATYSMPSSGAYTVILYAFQRDANKPRDGWLSNAGHTGAGHCVQHIRRMHATGTKNVFVPYSMIK